MDDYPNDGEWFAGVIKQQRDIHKDKDTVVTSNKAIKQLISILDERIAFYTTIDSVQVSLADDPILYQRYIDANRLVRDILQQEKDNIASLLKQD